MRTVFLVEGCTGEYSDRREWPVKAFASEERAKALVTELAAWCDERACGENAPRSAWSGGDRREVLAAGCPLDPDFDTYYPVILDEDP